MDLESIDNGWTQEIELSKIKRFMVKIDENILCFIEENNYSKYLDEYTLQDLIKRYSNYVRYPIKMEVTKSREKEKPKDAGKDYTPEYEDYKEIETINSMIPI